MAPSVTDPVVIDGLKYRIASIDYGTPAIVSLRTSFKVGAHRAEAQVRLDELVWDPRAGVWRQGVL